MRHLAISVISVAAFMFCITCCTRPAAQDGKEEGGSVPTEITLSQESYEAPQEGGSVSLTVTSPTRPSITGANSWITVPDGTYNSSTYKITYPIKVAANNSEEDRSAALTIKAGSLSREFVISQPGKEAESGEPKEMTLDKHSLTIRQAGGQASLIVTAPSEPSVSGVPSWLELTQSEYKNYKKKFTFKASENDSYDELSAEVTVTAGTFTDKLTVIQEPKFKDPDAIDNVAWNRGMELGLGWNMGNHFDAYANGVANETAWQGKSATQATFTGLKAKGFTSVRIPATWMGHIGEAPDYTLDDVWLNRIYEVVGFAENAGLNVILNTHHDEDHGENDGNHWQNLKGAVDSEEINTQVKEEIAAVWTQIATKFKDKGEFLMLESFNELIYGDQWSSSSNTEKKCDVINQWNQVFVNAVRATGGKNATRWLGVPGYAASPSYLKYLTVPDDPADKTMLAFHCYDPYDYTIGAKQLADWGHTGSAYKNGENEIKSLFKGIYENYIAKNIPIYMGEFGCSMRNKSSQRSWAFYLYYLEYVVKAARTYGIAPFLWDNGSLGESGEGYGMESHPYINHGTGDYMPNGREPVETMVKAWFTHSDTYNLQSVYDSAPTF